MTLALDALRRVRTLPGAAAADTDALQNPLLMLLLPMLLEATRPQIGIVQDIEPAAIAAAFATARNAPTVPEQLIHFLSDASLIPADSEAYYPGLPRSAYKFFAFIKVYEAAWQWEDVELVAYKPVSAVRSTGQRGRRFRNQQINNNVEPSARPRESSGSDSEVDAPEKDIPPRPRKKQHVLVCIFRTDVAVARGDRLRAVPWMNVRQRPLCVLPDHAEETIDD